MPMPQPKDNEKQNDYMGRCMDFLSKEERTNRPQKQKVAICLNTFNTPKKKAKADRQGIEIDFSDKIKEIKDKKAREEAEKQAKSQPVIEEKVQNISPVIEKKIEAPAPEIKVEAPVAEPTHTAVTAPAEPVIETPVTEVKVEESKI